MSTVQDTAIAVVESAGEEERQDNGGNPDVRDGCHDQPTWLQCGDDLGKDTPWIAQVLQHVREHNDVVAASAFPQHFGHVVALEVERNYLVENFRGCRCRCRIALNSVNSGCTALIFQAPAQAPSATSDIEDTTRSARHQRGHFRPIHVVIAQTFLTHRRYVKPRLVGLFASARLLGKRGAGTLRRAYHHLPLPTRRILRPFLPRGIGDPQLSDEDHPERSAVLDHLAQEPTLEVGCGPRKTRSDFVGVDLVPAGQLGRVGSAAGRQSQADVAGDGGMLPFRGESFGTLVARHNLEHYVDLIGVLLEWRRVLRPGGRLIAVVPDEDAYPGRTLDLDPTHFHAFNQAFARRLFETLGWHVILVEPCVANWSMLVVAERHR